MKKILIVANEAKEHIMKFHIPTIKMLKDNGWVVHVACGGREKIPFCDCQIQLPCNRNPFRFPTLKSIYILKKIIQKENYNIVHCHTATGGLIARIAAIGTKKNGLKVFYTAHGLHFYKGSSAISWILYLPVEYILSIFTDLLITINKEDYINAKKLLKAKEIVKINGAGVNLLKFSKNDAKIRDCMRTALGISAGAVVLIYVAELSVNKNQSALIKMMKILREQMPNAVLLLVGPDRNGGRYQAIAKGIAVESYVKFLGWRDDVPQLLAAADYALASSKSEGLGLNLVEAMAAGLPVIAFVNRGHKEIITDQVDGFLIEEDNIQKMAETILRLNRNNVLKTAIINNAKEKIKILEQDKILCDLREIYRNH